MKMLFMVTLLAWTACSLNAWPFTARTVTSIGSSRILALPRAHSARLFSTEKSNSCAVCTCGADGRTDADKLSIKSRLSADMKAAMKAKDKVKLAVVRSIQNAINQKEKDDRVEVE